MNLSLFDLVADPPPPQTNRMPTLPRPVIATPALPTRATVSGWMKTYQGPPLSPGSVTSLATMTHVQGDGHAYQEAQFRLADGVTVEEYPGGFGFRGLRVKGQKELISLYDAVRRDLAWEVT